MTERALDLLDRLRGKYVLPVNDGAGLLDGKDTFTRQFETPPIQHEAAAEIERLRKVAEWCKRRLGSAYGPHVDKMIAGEVPPTGLAKFYD